MSTATLQQITSFLAQTPLLQGAPANFVADVAKCARPNHYAMGQRVYSPAQPVGGLGLLVSGQLRLQLVETGQRRHIDVEELKPGETFAEEEVLRGSSDSYAAVAVSEVETLVLPIEEVRRVLLQSAPLSLRLAQRLSVRSEQVATLALVGSGDDTQQINPSRVEGRVPLVEIGAYDIGAQLLSTIPVQTIQKRHVLPLQYREGVLTVGMVNPYAIEPRQELAQVLRNMKVEVAAISQREFEETCMRLRLDGPAAARPAARTGRPRRIVYATEQVAAEKQAPVIGDEVIAMADRIFVEALEVGASDIHIEPEATGLSVRYRVAGTLSDRSGGEISSKFAGPLVARIKVLANLDVTERRQPQDGRINASVEGQDLNMRVAAMPVTRGQKIVIRIIDPSNAMRPLQQVFLVPQIADAVKNALSEPYGAIVVAGTNRERKIFQPVLDAHRTSAYAHRLEHRHG